jgi:hypothetical protein
MTIKPKIRYGYIYHFVFTRPTDGHEFHYIGQHAWYKANPRYFGSGVRLRRLINKYGRKDNLKRYGLMWCYSEEELDFAETLMIGFAKQVYGDDCINLQQGGSNGLHAEATRKKISTALKSYWDGVSAEDRAAFRAAQKDKPPPSEATRARMRDAWTGRPPDTQETRAKRRASMIGKKHTTETKLKISLAATGKKRSKEARANMSAGSIGKVLSPEHRAKMCIAQQRRRLLESVAK